MKRFCPTKDGAVYGMDGREDPRSKGPPTDMTRHYTGND